MFGFLKKKQKWQSPNFNDRVLVSPDRAEPSMILLHYTGMETAKDALERLCDPQAEVSAHYVVEEDGCVHHLVPDEKRAWHAGLSYWEGLTDINSAALGIEIVNKGHEFGYEAFPPEQIEAVLHLCRRLCHTYAIQADKVLGHSDVAPSRKTDPGEKFPWDKLARHGIGLWPMPLEMDFQAAEDLILNQDGVVELLGGYGYNPQEEREVLITTFHRHFYPRKFEGDENPAEPDVASIARLLSLIRQKHELV